jgi:hypothetical protein
VAFGALVQIRKGIVMGSTLLASAAMLWVVASCADGPTHPDVPTRLQVVDQPSDTARSGLPLTRQPVLQLLDAEGRAVAVAGVSVTVTLERGGGALSGSTTVQTDGSGRGAFAGIAIAGMVGTHTLLFSAPGLTSATSSPIELTPGLPTRLALTTQPPDSAYAGVPLGRQPEVQVRDSAGNDVPDQGVFITPSLATGRGSVSPPTAVQTDADGLAVFSGLAISEPGLHQLAFSASGLGTVLSTDVGVIVSFACALTNPADADNDRLPDCVESNTGVFVSLTTDTGTDPNDPDTDGDAINDGDEVMPTVDWLDLAPMGTNPLKKNILIEYHWFDDALDCGFHSHRPSATALALVSAAFAAAPVANPDGTTGITLIHDHGQGGPFTGGSLIEDPDGRLVGNIQDREFLTYKAANFAPNRRGYFHYVMLPHVYEGGSIGGNGEIVGDDVILWLSCSPSDRDVPIDLMHELGHNLSLRHGGNVDEPNFKPNYNSIMNYLYSLSGPDGHLAGADSDCTPPGNGVIQYSTGTRIPLDENNLDETEGICGNPPGPGVDWNLNGSATDVSIAADINGDGQLQLLEDYNDWANLDFAGIIGSDAPPPSAPELVTCQLVRQRTGGSNRRVPLKPRRGNSSRR